MGEIATKKFFETLNAVSLDILGPESAIVDATRRALNDPAPENLVMVQEALMDASEDQREAIMRKVHSQLRNNIEAIWDQLPYANIAARPN